MWHTNYRSQTPENQHFYKLLIKLYATEIENARNNIIAVNIYPVNIAIKHPPIKANHIKSSIIQPPVVY